ncbi:MAG: NfeD family protein [Verrucomicrobiales bacterium]
MAAWQQLALLYGGIGVVALIAYHIRHRRDRHAGSFSSYLFSSPLRIPLGVLLWPAVLIADEIDRRIGYEVDAEMRTEAARRANQPPPPDFRGCRGVALTPLRPTGKIRIDGNDPISARSRSGTVERGMRVVVVGVEMNEWIVAEDSTDRG